MCMLHGYSDVESYLIFKMYIILYIDYLYLYIAQCVMMNSYVNIDLIATRRVSH